MSKAQRYAEKCKPLPAVAGESLEERVDRLDRSLDYLTQCFQDEFEVRDEGTLLVDVITQILLPFAAISTAVSLLYVRLVGWASTNFPSFERVAATLYLVLLAIAFVLLVVARKSGRLSWVNRTIDKSNDFVHPVVPPRKETVTRNSLVNGWIYLWVLGSLTIFIPLMFIGLRSGIANNFGVELAIDTANVCDGPGRFRIFAGSETCVDIQEEHLPESGITTGTNAVGADSEQTIGSPVDMADSPADARVAEIQLDTTTTLGLAIIALILGILVSMGRWWWRNRNVRKIDLM